MFKQIYVLSCAIKERKPLLLNITNHVTIDFVANGLLSIGASPVMSFAPEEMAEFVKISAAVVINLGTLTDNFITLCHTVCSIANAYHKPIILDPVGAGASRLRTETGLALLKQYAIAVVRGNASEIMALTSGSATTKGVDSQNNSLDAIPFAQQLANDYQLVVCMSGAVDVIVARDKKMAIHRGSPLMPMVTGSGCLLTAVIGAFNAVHDDCFAATCAGSFFYAVCGELAAQKAQGPGSFKMHFVDVLHHMPEKKYYE